MVDDIFRLSIEFKLHHFYLISPKFVPKNLIDNRSALVQEVIWHQTGDKLLSEPTMAQFTDAYIRQSDSMF